jgi:serine/threonine protein kinase
VVDRLGVGSLGTVYLCDEIRTAKRVALKIFRREFAKDEEFMARLRRQVKLAAALNETHPGILAVYDCDRTDDGGAFLVTEYVDGRTLKEVIRRNGPLDVRRALRLACQIAEGLDAIHTRGFVHTDIRSQNVIVTKAGEGEAVKLKGFEVAGLRDTALAGHLIRAGVLPSNPEYAAPEQIEGDQVTARTDIYAFGVILYEMLSGRVPFLASIPDGVLAKQLQETPIPLSAVRREIPSVLELRVKQALEKEPERRQRYIGDVANEYLCGLAAEELAAEQARQKGGVIRKIVTTVQSRLLRQGEFSAEGEPLGMGWKVAAVVALLALLSFPAIWLFSAFQKSASTRAPALQQPLEAPRVIEAERAARPAGAVPESPALPGPAVVAPEMPETEMVAAEPPGDVGVPEATDATRTQAEAVESPVPPLPRESSLRPPGPTGRVETGPRRPERVEAPATTGRRAAPTPPPSRRETPLPTRGTPDPSAIIDWLMGQPPGRE